MNLEKEWKAFLRSGSVADYLLYKSIEKKNELKGQVREVEADHRRTDSKREQFRG